MRVLHVAESVQQEHVIILTVDEALNPKLIELKWSVDRYKDVLLPSLGGLHIGMNFLDILGCHMDESCLCEFWIECDVLGVDNAQKMMAGNGYARSMRTHKLKLSFEGDHEEADTCLSLHCIHAHVESMSLSYCWRTMTKWDVHLYF